MKYGGLKDSNLSHPTSLLNDTKLRSCALCSNLGPECTVHLIPLINMAQEVGFEPTWTDSKSAILTIGWLPYGSRGGIRTHKISLLRRARLPFHHSAMECRVGIEPIHLIGHNDTVYHWPTRTTILEREVGIKPTTWCLEGTRSINWAIPAHN